jgi:hypothetical protein
LRTPELSGTQVIHFQAFTAFSQMLRLGSLLSKVVASCWSRPLESGASGPQSF